MQEQIRHHGDHWYVWRSEERVGPFSTDQIVQMINTKLIANDTLLSRGDDHQLRHAADCLDDLHNRSSRPKTPPALAQASAAPNPVSGRVIAHNDHRMVIGKLIRLSESHLFMASDEAPFEVGEHLKITVRPEGNQRPFNTMAQVVSHGGEPAEPKGFNLRLL
jgi:hypothetical protein